MTEATVLVVPGLRDHVERHWQTLLATRLPRVRTVPPMGREDLDRRARVDAIERCAQAIHGPLVIVAHSGGCIMLAHWAQRTTRQVRGALLATPPDFERPMPDGYPTTDALRAGGWLPVPRDDPLGAFDRVAELAAAWGAGLADLGEVGHLNPASGYGEWPHADRFIDQLSAAADAIAAN
jgi:predicted alpha/beta hydrolase family esterase